MNLPDARSPFGDSMNRGCCLCPRLRSSKNGLQSRKRRIQVTFPSICHVADNYLALEDRILLVTESSKEGMKARTLLTILVALVTPVATSLAANPKVEANALAR